MMMVRQIAAHKTTQITPSARRSSLSLGLYLVLELGH
jgi:hypothetical protein